jgi:hypothetical protein
MELTPEQQQAYYDSLPKQPAYKPSQRRRRRQNGQRLARSLVHIDKDTKNLLTEMSLVSGVPQIQLVAYAIRTMADVMQAEAVAAEQAEANKIAEEGEQLANDSEARGE